MTGQSSETRGARERARTCAECGTESSPNQSFCDGCGAVLGWGPGGESAAPPAPAPAPTPAPAPMPAPAPAPGERTGPGTRPRDPADDWPGTARPGPGSAAAPDYGPGTPARGTATGGVPAQDAATGAAPAWGPAGGEAAAWGPGSGGDRGDADTLPRMSAQPADPYGVGPVPDGGEPVPYGAGPVPDGGGSGYANAPSASGQGPAPAGFPQMRPHGDSYGQPAAGPAGQGARPFPAAQDPQGPGAAPDQQDSAAAERARALLIPVADPQRRQPAPSSVAPVLPGRPVAARPEVRAPGLAPDEDGATACPWCGTGNRQDRHFCRRCAMTLAGRPQDPAQRPWWRRLLDWRRRATPWAGDRPRLRWGIGRIGTWVVAAGAAALVVVGALNVGSGVQATRDHFAKRAPIAPDSVAASHSYKGHGPSLAFDEFSNTWWGPGISEAGAGEWLEARFQQPTRLLNIVITPGVSSQPADLSKSADPHNIEVRITTSKGQVSTRQLTLDQGSGGQALSFRASDVTSVRFTIRSSYGAAPRKQVAIAEIEFFGRSHSST